MMNTRKTRKTSAAPPLHRSTVNLLLRKYSEAASLPLLAHPHMLCHACGFALADQGADTRLIQDYLRRSL
jgi:type 1 fimbriae regulatory protein FimB